MATGSKTLILGASGALFPLPPLALLVFLPLPLPRPLPAGCCGSAGGLFSASSCFLLSSNTVRLCSLISSFEFSITLKKNRLELGTPVRLDGTFSMTLSNTMVGVVDVILVRQMGQSLLFLFHMLMQYLQNVWEQLRVNALMKSSEQITHCNSFSIT